MSEYDEEDDSTSAIHAKFEAVNDDFIKFERIPVSERPFSSPDLCAFAMLDKKFPAERDHDMVSAAEHDVIYLRIEGEQVAQLTDDEILYLTRCGIFHDEEYDCLSSFV
jgi:hypothetical protein